MINVVKQALRVSHSALDDEILDLIEASRMDLIQSGVSNLKANDDTDALIKRAIILYAKANFLVDKDQAMRFQHSYDLLKIHLSLATDYKASDVNA